MFRLLTRWAAPVVSVIVAIAVLSAGRAHDRELPGDSSDADFAVDRAADRQFDEQRVAHRRRMDHKEFLVRRLIGGHATLDEVATEFLRMNRESPEAVLRSLRAKYPDTSDDQAAALNVLDFVEDRVERGAEGDAVLARLREEFRQQYGHESQSSCQSK